MPSTTTIRHYGRLRAKGWHARQALDAARTFALADMIGEDMVRIRDEYDDSGWETVLDFDGTPEEKEREAKRAEREGVYGIIGEWYNDATDKWEHADSVWGFIGEDWIDSGYDADVLQSAIDEYLKHTRPLATMLTAEGAGL